MLECCTLGTGGALPLPDRALASLYVRTGGRGLLIDCGDHTLDSLRIQSIPTAALDTLLTVHPQACLLDAFMPDLDAITVKQRYEEKNNSLAPMGFAVFTQEV